MEVIRYMTCIVLRNGVILDNGIERHRVPIKINEHDDTYDFELRPEWHLDFLLFLKLNQNDIYYHIKELRKTKLIAKNISIDIEGLRYINGEKIAKLGEKKFEYRRNGISKWIAFLESKGYCNKDSQNFVPVPKEHLKDLQKEFGEIENLDTLKEYLRLYK